MGFYVKASLLWWHVQEELTIVVMSTINLVRLISRPLGIPPPITTWVPSMQSKEKKRNSWHRTYSMAYYMIYNQIEPKPLNEIYLSFLQISRRLVQTQNRNGVGKGDSIR